MDAVVLLRFPDTFVNQYSLYPGMRLTTSNVYFMDAQCAGDIFVGEHYSRQYTDFMPIVQLFLGKKDEKILAKAELFDENTWNRVREQANEYVNQHPELYRDGFFYFKK